MDNDYSSFLDGILKTVNQTAATTAANAQQLGVVITQVQTLEVGQRELEQKHDALATSFEDYKKAQKEKEYIEPEQSQELDQLITNRVNDLLNANGISISKYFGKFKSKAWQDGKKHSFVVGKAGVYTKRMFFEDVKEYYGTWTPHGYGVEGYVNHLNILKEDKK